MSQYLKTLENEFYQTEWHGIDLIEIAKKNNIPINTVAKSDFYDYFYKKLKSNNFSLDPNWVKKKEQCANKIISTLKQVGLSKSTEILSIGSGLGVIEQVLLDQNYSIHLQECQESSFDYLKSQNIAFNYTISKDLSSFKNNSFEMCYSMLVLYIFNINELKTHLTQVYSLLKPGGYYLFTCIPANFKSHIKTRIYETLLTLKIKKLKKSRLNWGYRRLPLFYKSLCKRLGFNVVRILKEENMYMYIIQKPK